MSNPNEITEAQHNAAGMLIESIATNIGGPNREVDPVTAISSCARLAGSFLFRSFNIGQKDIKPGNVVLSENANVKGPELTNITGWMLQNLGINLDNNAIQAGKNVEAPISFNEAISLVQNDANAIKLKQNLSFEQMAKSAAMATAFIIKECKDQLPVETGFNTAVYSYIEGSKTYPPDFNTGYSNQKSKPWYKFW